MEAAPQLDKASEFAESTLDFIDQIRVALLEVSSVYELSVRLPVPGISRGTFVETLNLLREGKPVPADRHGQVLNEAVESLVEKFEDHYRDYQRRKAEEAGVRLGDVRLLTGGEKRHLKMFVQWLVLEEVKRIRSGRLNAELEKVYELTEDGSAD